MVLALVDDLLFSSKIRSVAEHLGEPIAFVRTRDEVVPALIEKGARAVIFDLDRSPLDPIGAIGEIRSRDDLAHVRLLAFVRHTSAETIARARQAGADVVLARSAFFPALATLLADRAAAPNAT
jgi:CheY-like chemotaxis protein